MAKGLDTVGLMDLKAAWEYEGITSMINGEYVTSQLVWTTYSRLTVCSGFDSQIFTLTVGPEAKSFTAHAAFLSQSPVFEKMCSGEFQESHTCEIKLPEDDPEVIRAFIQYLYTGNFLDFGSMESGHGPKGAELQLARLYMTAEKYQMQNLKVLILGKLFCVLDPEQRPLDFLSIAGLMYDNIPDSDSGWRTLFKNCAIYLPKPSLMSKSIRTRFDNCLHRGGAQAVDMMEATWTLYDATIDFIRADVWESKTHNQRSPDLR